MHFDLILYLVFVIIINIKKNTYDIMFYKGNNNSDIRLRKIPSRNKMYDDCEGDEFVYYSESIFKLKKQQEVCNII